MIHLQTNGKVGGNLTTAKRKIGCRRNASKTARVSNVREVTMKNFFRLAVLLSAFFMFYRSGLGANQNTG